ncbi:hypothetical protein NDU88_002861 [Pleurodeles waltl]|uniref:Uncharacterized protein n=1 Tax=Pleurodeles waltl TaxID=8319 RepID=A0AAV7PGI7_PLEWA|nr:hypothetical protein NDU88_002861 [Pleurodeles waltl]
MNAVLWSRRCVKPSEEMRRGRVKPREMKLRRTAEPVRYSLSDACRNETRADKIRKNNCAIERSAERAHRMADAGRGGAGR